MVRIGIPIFHDRVSPVLDTCSRLLIIDFEDNVEIERREVFTANYSVAKRFELIQKAKLNVIICCGISDVFDRMLQTTDIQLICGIAGRVDQVAEAFICDKIDDPCFWMPGYKGNR